MFSDNIKPENFYYIITENQFIGTYYVLSDREDFFVMLIRYYPGNNWEVSYPAKDSFDWDDDDEELPYDAFFSDSIPISRLSSEGEWRSEIKDYFKSFIPHMFTKGLP